jgi:8-oxo-dGTP diphosphatase
MPATPRPQFGEPHPGLSYRLRPSAYGIALREGQIALVRVTLPGKAPFHDLPGGGVDDGESETGGLVREFGEETGLVVQAGQLITRADQYMVSAHGEPFNSHGAFFETAIVGAKSALKIEDSHELVWAPAHRALTLLRHDSHAWAVTAWLRKH